ncbi:hypothetical protein ACFLZ1_00555 [Patescibacteria group bacterium]
MVKKTQKSKKIQALNLISFNRFIKVALKRISYPFLKIRKELYKVLPFNISNKFVNDSFYLLFLSLLVFFLIISYLKNWQNNNLVKANISLKPLSVKNHLDLANYYFSNGELLRAKNELKVAKNIYKYVKIFDYNQNLIKDIDLTSKIIQTPDKIKKEVNDLQTIIAVKPNFRDIYLKLSLYYFQIWDNEKAYYYWQKAFYLDPNNVKVKEIGKLIEVL